ncbi:lithostathine-1 [Procambarus clarkii]
MLRTLLVLCLALVVCSSRRADIEEPEFESPIEAETGNDVEELDCKIGFIRIAGNCYSFNQIKMSWSNAELACNNQEAQLASVLDDEQYNGLLGHINANYPGTYWTSGAIRSGQWIWTTNGKLMAQKWWGRNPGTAPNQCAYFCSKTLKYWNKQCDGQLGFICEEVKKTVPEASKYTQQLRRKSWNRLYY